MSSSEAVGIRGIVFDLDGTLYVCDRYAAEIQNAAAGYIAGVRRISRAEALQLIDTTRLKLAEEYGTVQTLSTVCRELGGMCRGCIGSLKTTCDRKHILSGTNG